jgi:hypothetical protein
VPVALLLALAVGTGGCADDGPTGPPEVTLGTGTIEFEPLADGDTILVVQGPQGGFHVWGSVQVGNIDPGNPDDLSDPANPTTEFRVFRGTDRIDVGAAGYVQGLDPAGDGRYQMIGRAVILDILADDELDGVDIRLTVDVTSASGDSAGDERTLVARPDPNNL